MKPALKTTLTVSPQLHISATLKQALSLLQDNSAMLEERLSSLLDDNIFLERSGDTQSFSDNTAFIEQSASPPPTLREYCLWQLSLSTFPAHHIHWPMAQWIADSLNDYGYLTEPLSELCARCHPTCSLEQAHHTLSCIQQLDPIGLGAKDAQEALTLQAKHLFTHHPLFPQLMQCLNHFQQWSSQSVSHNLIDGLSEHLSCSSSQATTLTSMLQQLNPKPGLPLGHFAPQYHSLDARITLGDHHQWEIDLNPMRLPSVALSSQNIQLFRETRDAPNRQLFTQQLIEARWLMQALKQRYELLKAVLHHVVQHQSNFLKTGQLSDLNPLSLAEMAKKTQRHPSSISRLVQHKWIATPVGDWPLSVFFQRHIGQHPISQAQLKARIQTLIQQEDPTRPYSDQEIASQLHGEDLLEISRRTVAKYRQALAIPKASQRKQRSSKTCTLK